MMAPLSIKKSIGNPSSRRQLSNQVYHTHIYDEWWLKGVWCFLFLCHLNVSLVSSGESKQHGPIDVYFADLADTYICMRTQHNRLSIYNYAPVTVSCRTRVPLISCLLFCPIHVHGLFESVHLWVCVCHFRLYRKNKTSDFCVYVCIATTAVVPPDRVWEFSWAADSVSCFRYPNGLPTLFVVLLIL